MKKGKTVSAAGDYRILTYFPDSQMKKTLKIGGGGRI